MEEVIITADIHLLPDDKHPINQNFYHFLQSKASKAKVLYLIGDTFEIWIGDDICIPEYQTVIQLFKKLTDNGLKIYLMYGNRDFLMGKKFWQATGIIKLEQPCQLELEGTKVILLHGDQLCTDDKHYQMMRKWFRNPIIQWLFLQLPKNKRIQIGQKMRKQSKQASANKTNQIMDVNQKAVEQVYQQYPESEHLIHGHTHQPALHKFDLNGKQKKRWVVGDWRPKAEYIEIKNQVINFKSYKPD